ncbi:DUF6477 family protein [Pseudogemmobacter humi]|uniref:Uncharacterized protein n=1 Tax=Pseudogemmobacter humi TaxID=2483812 RepID=A0A3P5XSH1_9RHOB|nr:DUF6477 family protein [Pseudogemmobacter humi]VDC31978.1 hypothetical protein XINFAN_03255 [Pseudogemmobacter humi]
MSDFRTLLAEMRRPGILMRAVRFGLADYQRQHMLKRLAPEETRPERILPRLFETEARLEETRQRGDANYSIRDHIEVLVTLVAETRAWYRPTAVQAG